jgi:toxin-antitoxin system PIN domain toxin
VSTVALLDVNVLVALFTARHLHHDAAHDWFTDNAAAGWASCPITEGGLLRILGNPARAGEHLTLPKLFEILKTFCDNTTHTFWPEMPSLRDDRIFNVEAIRGHQQLTDVHLLGLAVKNGGRFVTLDQRVPLSAVKGANRASLEVIAPAD